MHVRLKFHFFINIFVEDGSSVWRGELEKGSYLLIPHTSGAVLRYQSIN